MENFLVVKESWSIQSIPNIRAGKWFVKGFDGNFQFLFRSLIGDHLHHFFKWVSYFGTFLFRAASSVDNKKIYVFLIEWQQRTSCEKNTQREEQIKYHQYLNDLVQVLAINRNERNNAIRNKLYKLYYGVRMIAMDRIFFSLSRYI